MPGVKALRKIQLGREATAGTAVAATTLWRGTGALQDNRQVTYVDEDVGILGGTDRAYIAQIGGQIAFADIPATFEQVLHILEAGVKSVGTGAADGGGSGKIYAYPFPTASLNTIKTYTIEGGDNQQAERMEYSFVEDFSLKGEGGGALMMSANWRGRQVTDNAFTGAISIPTVEDILFTKGKFYIDAVGGTIGTTQKSALLIAMDLSVKTGLIPKWMTDGNLYFSIHQFTKPEITVSLTYEHDANAVAEKAVYRAGTPRLFRLDFEGSSLGTPGTSFSKKTLRLDLAAKYESWDALGDKDGNDVVTCKLRSRYNSTAALFAELKVVNELASVP